MSSLFGSYNLTQLTWQTTAFSFLMAFLLSAIIAKVYEITYQGLSWSKSLVQALILGSIVTCLIMMAIGDNLARGIGIIGSLAIIRFRTNLRDPRDMVFIFSALGVGVASGVQSYAVAVMGTTVYCLVALMLRFADLGTWSRHEGYVRFQIPSGAGATEQITKSLRSHTKRFNLVTMRDVAQGQNIDFTYQVRLASEEDAVRLMGDLDKIDGIRGLKYMSQQSTAEV
jgi:uncharacterized membrane protein YhiD involved in acid resistance